MNRKRKRIIVGVIIGIFFIGVCIAIICAMKYKEAHRYLTYEELEPSQIVLIKEWTGEIDGVEKVRIRAVDAEGDEYYSEIPYKEWEGIEKFFANATSGEKTTNRINDENIERMYKFLLRADESAEYKCITMTYINPEKPSVTTRACYGIRYRADGTMEYVKFWEKPIGESEYLLDDPAIREVYYAVGTYL